MEKIIRVDESELLSVIKRKLEMEAPNSKLVTLYEELVDKNQEENSYFDIKSLVTDIESEEDIENIFKITDTKENGGVIAMSGFYFQFLVSIEYLIELIEDKWTHLVVDQHQDIIVFNKDTIRFIQVKTKNVQHIAIGSTTAHSEWIPKLIMMREIFEGYDLTFEYELVTNFILDNSPKICKNIEGYRHNEEFSNGEISGSVFSYIKKLAEKNEQFEYLTQDKIEKSLKNFKTTKKNVEDYPMKLCSKIGDLFYQNAKAKEEDLNYVIGYLIKKCYFPKDKSVQIVNSQEALILKEELRKRVAKPLEKDVKNNQSEKIINDFIKKMNEEYTNSSIYSEFFNEISIFEKELNENFEYSKSETIHSILSRFSEKKYSFSEHIYSEKENMFNEVERLLKIMVYMKVHFGGELKIDPKSKCLLVTDIGDKPVNFYAVKDTCKLDEAISEFKDIFHSLAVSEQYHVISKPKLKIVMSGDYINDDYESGMSIEVEPKERPESQEMKLEENKESKSIAKVQNSFQIIDGYDDKIGKIHKKRNIYQSMLDLKNQISKELEL